ncbi:hypothetical protein CEXT_538941 [Caerostris extrusa]|uniref:Uncharacterized protein n=1 Tax=Caerostris extrusa TaxID=172846 RepID=A0AAV4RP18_CAEEX|nr:hypothetical protein CEXT_538941 [Caerostris extrusa]
MSIRNLTGEVVPSVPVLGWTLRGLGVDAYLGEGRGVLLGYSYRRYSYFVVEYIHVLVGNVKCFRSEKHAGIKTKPKCRLGSSPDPSSALRCDEGTEEGSACADSVAGESLLRLHANRRAPKSVRPFSESDSWEQIVCDFYTKILTCYSTGRKTGVCNDQIVAIWINTKLINLIFIAPKGLMSHKQAVFDIILCERNPNTRTACEEGNEILNNWYMFRLTKAHTLCMTNYNQVIGAVKKGRCCYEQPLSVFIF